MRLNVSSCSSSSSLLCQRVALARKGQDVLCLTRTKRQDVHAQITLFYNLNQDIDKTIQAGVFPFERGYRYSGMEIVTN